MSIQRRYSFKTIENCNMCGSAGTGHKVLGRRMDRSQGKDPRSKIGLTTTVVRCTECGLIYSNPQPIPYDLQDHYGVPPESYWKEEYFELSDDYFQTEIKRAKELVPFRAGMRSLDIGAGLGKQMLALTKAGYDAFGLEASAQFHERAISRMGIDRSRLRLGGLEDTEYPENEFDLISFGAVLEHLYDPSASIIKAMRWLKPGGVMHIEVPSSDWLIGKFINLYYRLTGTDYVGNLSPMHEPYHLHEFSLRSFELHSNQHGYLIAHHEYYVCQTYMPAILDPLLKTYMARTNTGMQLCVWLRKTS